MRPSIEAPRRSSSPSSTCRRRSPPVAVRCHTEGPMTTAAVRPNQREHILDVTLQLMSEQGAGRTSMRQLAAACGLNVAAIYHYFPSKDALLAAVIDERR